MMDEKVMFKLSYGLFVLTARHKEKDNGCIINTGIQVTVEPNRVVFAVNHSNYTQEMLQDSDQFALSVLSQEAAFSLFLQFGFQSGRDVDKFAEFSDFDRAENGVAYITKGTNAYIAGEIEQRIDLGSHTLFIGKVTDGQVLSDAASATYEYYHAAIKPKPERSKEKKEGKTVWRCKICGFEYEGEELPEDYICPICKHPASDFEKVII